jgi:hypothetical protein
MGITNSEEGWMRLLDFPDWRTIYSESCRAFGATVRKTMSAEVSRRVVITAIALKRYQLKHGNFPKTLSPLKPEFLASLPSDPVDGNPLRYHLNTNGAFLLYSIGENGVDDGGDPTMGTGAAPASYQWQNLRARDWVWPQPATAEEIQRYTDEQANKSK